VKLKFKLSIFISLIIFLILASAAVLIIMVRSSEIRQDLTFRDKITSEKMVADLVNDMDNYYVFQFDTYAQMVNNTLKEDSDILHIRIINANGDILFDSSEIQNGKYNKTAKRAITDRYILKTIYSQQISQDFTTYNNQEVIRVLTPYTDNYGVYRAMVEFYFSIGQINSSINQMIIYFSTLFGIFLVLGVLFTLIFANQITKPIVKLTEGVRELGKGNLNVSVKVNTGDELGELSVVFNQMATQIKGYYNELEQKVTQRTKELEDIKKTLETSNISLKNRAEDLEKINKIMIDRELKMIELKKKIAELESKQKIG
jgi:two-component system NtrC family sensor kinase